MPSACPLDGPTGADGSSLVVAGRMDYSRRGVNRVSLPRGHSVRAFPAPGVVVYALPRRESVGLIWRCPLSDMAIRLLVGASVPVSAAR